MKQPVIDGHHHIWQLRDLPWLQAEVKPRIFGDYRAIQRDYPITEYLADIEGSGVVKSVYVQTNWPADQALDEVRWVQSVSDCYGFPQAIVGYADLSHGNLRELLTEQTRYANVRGVRQQIYWHENPAYRFASNRNLMNDPGLRRGLRTVGEFGLLFELQVFPGQMSDAVALAQAFPEVCFVLIHAGMLESTSREHVEAWRRGMDGLASCANVFVKLSGLNTFMRRHTPGLVSFAVRETVAFFGAYRCLFGSNFPIEKIWASYEDVLDAVRNAIADLTPEQQSAILYDTAANLYRI